MFKPELPLPGGNAEEYALRFRLWRRCRLCRPAALRCACVTTNSITKICSSASMKPTRWVKIYVVVNIAPHNAKLKTFIRDLKPVVEMCPDALIMSDPGLIMLVREHFPEMPIHLSVQANAVNWATVKFWQQMGLTRVILSRELSLDEIEEIRRRCRRWRSRFSSTARCAWPTRPLPALRVYQQARPEPGDLHQRLPLGIQRGGRQRGRRRQHRPQI